MVIIKKAKIVGGNLELIVKRQDGKGPKGNNVEKYEDPVHPDLLKALDKLRVHYGCILGLIQGGGVKDTKKVKEEVLEGYRVSGFYYKGKNDDAIGLTGMIKTPSGWSALNAAPQFIEGSEEKAYAHIDELVEVVEEVKKEVLAFLAGEKMGQAKQASLDLPDAEDQE